MRTVEAVATREQKEKSTEEVLEVPPLSAFMSVSVKVHTPNIEINFHHGSAHRPPEAVQH